MNNIKGYYNSLKVNITFDDTKLKIGTKAIPYDKIYYIKEDYITNYPRVLPLVLMAIGTILGAVISLIIVNTISLFAIIFGIVLGAFISLYTIPKIIIDKYPNEYLKIVDIILADRYDSFIVKTSEVIPKNKIEPKNKNDLVRYIGKIKKARKYLVRKIEFKKDNTVQNILNDFQDYSKNQCQISQTLGLKSLEILIDSYEVSAGKYVQFGYRVARFSAIFIIIVGASLLLTKILGYHNFF